MALEAGISLDELAIIGDQLNKQSRQLDRPEYVVGAGATQHALESAHSTNPPKQACQALHKLALIGSLGPKALYTLAQNTVGIIGRLRPQLTGFAIVSAEALGKRHTRQSARELIAIRAGEFEKRGENGGERVFSWRRIAQKLVKPRISSGNA